MHTLRVLIIDDEQSMRQIVEQALCQFQLAMGDIDINVRFAVDSAINGSDGWDKIGDFKPDIILLDNNLPDISGMEILEKITAQDHDMLTLMITAQASLNTAVQATKRGAYDFMAKPFTADEIREIVRKAARHLLLQRQAQRLTQENRQVRFQFISILAHEMKSPLAAVEGYLQLILTKPLGDQVDAYREMLNRSVIRLEGMRKLIHDLLDLTAIESGRRRHLQPILLQELIGTALESVLPECEQRQIRICSEIPEQFSLHADRSEIEIIMNNLISNAVKYNRDGGQIDIQVKPDAANDQLTIIVSDTGIGMSPDESKRLFDDFVRIKNVKTRNILGSGLGLSTVRKIVQLYNGNIDVVSEPDHGSVFTIILPINRNAAAESKHVDTP